MRRRMKYLAILAAVAVLLLALSGCLPTLPNKPPEVLYLNVPPSVDSGASFEVKFKAVDPEKGILEFTLRFLVDGELVDQATGTVESGQEFVKNFLAPDVEEDKPAQVEVQVVDKGGKSDEANAAFIIKATPTVVENKAPELEISVDKSELTLTDLEPTGTVNLTIVATDDQDNVLNYLVTLNGEILEGGILNAKSYSFEKTVSIEFDKDKHAGPNSIAVEVWDKEGLRTTKVTEVYVEVPGRLVVETKSSTANFIGKKNKKIEYEIKYVKDEELTYTPDHLIIQIKDPDGSKVFEKSVDYEDMDVNTDEYAIEYLDVSTDTLDDSTKSGVFEICATLYDTKGSTIVSDCSSFIYYNPDADVELDWEIDSDYKAEGWLDGEKPATVTVKLTGGDYEVLMSKEDFLFEIQELNSADAWDAIEGNWKDAGDYLRVIPPITLTLVLNPLTNVPTEVSALSTATWKTADGFTLSREKYVNVDSMAPRLKLFNVSADGHSNYHIEWQVFDVTIATPATIDVYVNDDLTKVGTHVLEVLSDGASGVIDTNIPTSISVDKGSLWIGYTALDKLGHKTTQDPTGTFCSASCYLDNTFGGIYKKTCPDFGECNWVFNDNVISFEYRLVDKSGVDTSFDKFGDILESTHLENPIIGASGSEGILSFDLRFDDGTEVYISAEDNYFTVYDKAGNSATFSPFDVCYGGDIVYDDLAPRATFTLNACTGESTVTIRDLTLQRLIITVEISSSSETQTFELSPEPTSNDLSTHTYDFRTDVGGLLKDYDGIATITIKAIDMVGNETEESSSWIVHTAPPSITIEGTNFINFDNGTATFLGIPNANTKLTRVLVHIRSDYKEKIVVTVDGNTLDPTPQPAGHYNDSENAYMYVYPSDQGYGEQSTVTIQFADGAVMDKYVDIWVEFFGESRCEETISASDTLSYLDLFPDEDSFRFWAVDTNESTKDKVIFDLIPGTPVLVDIEFEEFECAATPEDEYNSDLPEYRTYVCEASGNVFDVEPVKVVDTLTIPEGSLKWKIWGAIFQNLEEIGPENVNAEDIEDYVPQPNPIEWDLLTDPTQTVVTLPAKRGVEWWLGTVYSPFQIADISGSHTDTSDISGTSDLPGAYVEATLNYDTGGTFTSNQYVDANAYPVWEPTQSILSDNGEATQTISAISIKDFMDQFSIDYITGQATYATSTGVATLTIRLEFDLPNLPGWAGNPSSITLCWDAWEAQTGDFESTPLDNPGELASDTDTLILSEFAYEGGHWVATFVIDVDESTTTAVTTSATVNIPIDGIALQFVPDGFVTGFWITNFDKAITIEDD